MSDPVIKSSRSVHDGRIVKLRVEEVTLPNGNTITLEIIKHPGAAAVLPVDHEGNAILVRQYRHATGSWLLEVPAGGYVGPYLNGYVKDATGSFLWASVVLAGLLAAGGALMLTLNKKPPQI